MAQIELDVPKQNCEFTRGQAELNVGLVNLMCLVHRRNTQYFKQHMAPAHRVIETSIPDQTSTSPTTRWMIHNVIMAGTSTNSSMIFQAIYTIHLHLVQEFTTRPARFNDTVAGKSQGWLVQSQNS